MVDIQPTTQTINDDQELAKVLAGVNQQVDSSMQFEETPAPAAPVAADATDPTVDPAAIAAPVAPSPEPAIPPVPAPVFDPAATFAPVDDLSPIKNEAINELRPLVDRLTLLQKKSLIPTYCCSVALTTSRLLLQHTLPPKVSPMRPGKLRPCSTSSRKSTTCLTLSRLRHSPRTVTSQ